MEGGDGRCSYRWIVEGDRVLGAIALRHGTSDFVQRVGHVGYGIRPSARRRGVATWALGEIIVEAGSAGMSRVLAVCAAESRVGEDDRAPWWCPRKHSGHRTRSGTAVLDQGR
ncbi:GNAT family N-acetyltransferase [Nocardia sp. NPDC058518]|uniref:GNAT family N-acetyltransferase n=1 Tax=Nocardia sp. NPDC058518 TaxID=3346534 RepID=UPI003646C3B4